MALASTVHAFDVTLSDVDRGVYDAYALTVARHPSETVDFLVARVLAHALEREEGVGFSQGLCVADDPAVEVRDLTGRRLVWIDIGTPDAERLHRASKATDRVAVYCHKDPGPWLRNLAKGRVHKADAIGLHVLDRAFVAAIAARVGRRTTLSVTRSDGQLFVEVDEVALEAPLVTEPWPVA